MIRAVSPVYVKLGLKKHADIYPAGGHLEGGIVVSCLAMRAVVRVALWPSTTFRVLTFFRVGFAGSQS